MSWGVCVGVGQSPHKQKAAGIARGLTPTAAFSRTSLSVETILFKNTGLVAMSSRLALSSGPSASGSRSTGVSGELPLHLSLVLGIAQ